MKNVFSNAESCWKAIMSDVQKNRGYLSLIERFARENPAPSQVVFGTSGWRGETGTDFTFANVRIVTAAIIRMFRGEDPAVMKELGVSGFAGVREKGVIVGHDSRFLGRDFAMEVIGLLQEAGIRTWYAGETITPEFSAAVEMLGAACSINLTPSHNPANYSGLKFNSSDGGPADTGITTAIEEIANRMMADRVVIAPVSPVSIVRIDLTELYLSYLQQRSTVDLDRIGDFLRSADCFICVDNVHGATRSRLERILGENIPVSCLRMEDDYLFGGIAPEPSEKNMAGAEAALRRSGARLKLGAIMDPDGDRIRLTDGSMQIPMNYFGAMVLHYLHVRKKIPGVAVKSVGTSNLVNAIAGKLSIPVIETKVGFKNFRPYLLRSSSERAIVAFEESDGISGYNHTLEKDAIFGLLLAMEMMAATGRNLSSYLVELMDEFGHYYPDRSGISVDRSIAGEPLLQKLSTVRQRYCPGTVLSVGGTERTVKDVSTVDGTKIVFDDGSWLMIRASGTEPKVRFYIEARTLEGRQAVFETAERITKEAIGTEEKI